jgi:hypothetical protein
MMTARKPTIEELSIEIDESQVDLDVLVRARDMVRNRVQSQLDHPVEGRLFDFVNWSGTAAVLGSMDMAIHSLERVIEELREERRKMTSPPVLRLVPLGEAS